jgi:autotransporter-associated beta strand protein
MTSSALLRLAPILAAGFSSALAQYADSQALFNSYAATPHTHQNVPNNSYAGYHAGRVGLPTVPVVANLASFGGIGDGVADNTEAFRAAIHAAWMAGGGAVEVPAGTYVVQGLIHLNRDGVVIRGAGQGQTILRFPNSMDVKPGSFNDGNGNTRWFWQGGSVWMSPAGVLDHDFIRTRTNDADTGEWWPLDGSNGGTKGRRYANVTNTPGQGSWTVQVDQPAALQVGHYYMMNWRTLTEQGDYDLWKTIAGHPLAQTYGWSSEGAFNSRYNFNWPVQITAITGNTVTLGQPLRLPIQSKWKVGLDSLGPVLTESGIEHLTVEITGAPDLPNDLGHDSRHNAIYLTKCVNCWVKNVTILNARNGIMTRATKHCELRDWRLEGTIRLHHGLSIVRGHDDLVTGFTFLPRVSHGLSIEDLASGNVHRDGNMGFGTTNGGGTFDSHRYMSFDTLRTNLYVLNEAGSPGGASSTGPLNGRRVVHWNIRGNTGALGGEWVNHPDSLSYGALVGVMGPRSLMPAWSMVTGDKGTVIVDEGLTPTIADLWVQQLNYRDTTENWVEIASPMNEVLGPGTVTVAINANAATPSTISSVSLLLNGVETSVDTTAPYGFLWNATGGSYVVQARMVTSAGTFWSSPRTLAIGTRSKIENDSASIVYSGAVTPTSDALASGGNFMALPVTRTATYTFRGTRVMVYSRLNSTAQTPEIFLDNMSTAAASPRPSGSAVKLNWLLYDSGILPDAKHTLRIATNGSSSMNLDYLIADLTNSNPNTASPPLVPSAPSQLAATMVTSSSARISWAPAVGGATSYRLERLTGSSWIYVGETAGNYLDDAGLTADTSYQYRVRAEHPGVFSDWSAALPVSITSAQVATTLTLSPSSGVCDPGATIGFTAVLRDQLGNAMAIQPSFTWSGATNGQVTAPAAPGGPISISVSAGSFIASATLTVRSPYAAPILSGKTWQGGNLAWAATTDADSFGAETYAAGDAVQFGNTGMGVVTMAATLTPSTITMAQSNFTLGNNTANYRFDPATAAATAWNLSGDLRLVSGITLLNSRNSASQTTVYQVAGQLALAGGAQLALTCNNNTAGRWTHLIVGDLANPLQGQSLLCSNAADGTRRWGPTTTSGTAQNKIVVTGLTKPSTSTNGMVSPGFQYYPTGNTNGDFMKRVDDLNAVGGNNLVPLDAADYNAGFDAASATEIANISSAVTLTADETTYATRVNTTSALNLGGFTLNLGSGGLLTTNTSVNNGTVNFGSAGGWFGHYNTASQATIGAKISGSGGLTFFGTCQIVNLTNNANNFTGGLVVNGTSVSLTTTAAGGNDVVVNAMGRIMTANSNAVVRIGGVSGRGRMSAFAQGGNTGYGMFQIETQAGSSYDFAGRVQDGDAGRVFSLIKMGAGTQILSGTGTHKGLNQVMEGTLVINGDFSGSTAETQVAAGAVLAGSGTLGGRLVANGVLSPSGVFSTTADAVWNSTPGNAWRFELGTDRLNAANLLGGQGSRFAFNFAGTGAPGTYTLVQWSGSTDIAASSYDYQGLAPGLTGTFAIVGNELRFTVMSAGGGDAYQTWAASFPTLSNSNEQFDFDGDGIPNLLEFVLNTNPTAVNTQPHQTQMTGGNLSFTFSRSDDSEPLVTLSLQVSDDLVSWLPVNDVPIGAASSAGVTVSENGSAPDTVTISIPPASLPRRFVRLKAVR